MRQARPIALLMAALFVWALAGCAPSLHKGLAVTEKGAKALDVGLDLAATGWETAVQERIADCRAKGLDTPEERRECMGKLADGDKVIPLLEQAGAAYDEIVRALETLDKLARELGPYLEAK